MKFFCFPNFGAPSSVLDLDTYVAVYSLGVFPLFSKKVADIIAPKLSIIFRRLIRLGSFPECLRSANITVIPKGTPSPDRDNCRHISITPILSKVYEKLVSQSCPAFSRNMVYCMLFSLLIGKVRAALLTISYHLQKSLDAGMESCIVQYDFSAAFDRVSHSGLLFILKYIGDNALSICTEILSNHKQRVVVDGAASEWIKMVSGMPQGRVLGPLLFVLYTSEILELVENRLFVYADNSTLPWQLFASQQTNLLLLPPLTGTLLGFGSGTITGARY